MLCVKPFAGNAARHNGSWSSLLHPPVFARASYALLPAHGSRAQASHELGSPKPLASLHINHRLDPIPVCFSGTKGCKFYRGQGMLQMCVERTLLWRRSLWSKWTREALAPTTPQGATTAEWLPTATHRHPPPPSATLRHPPPPSAARIPLSG